MKNFIFFLGIIIVFSLKTFSLYACEPCSKILNFEQTAQKADLIILGRKVEDGPMTDNREEMIRLGVSGPEWITVKVLKILKGESLQGEIKVNSWDGMCDYGIVIDDKIYVMFLEKEESQAGEEDTYGAVSNGCGVKTYLLSGNTVAFEMSLESFEEQLKDCLQIKDVQIPQTVR